MQPTHCGCAARGMDQMANYITQKLDTAMFDPNQRTQGTVSIHGDPAADILAKLGRHQTGDY